MAYVIHIVVSAIGLLVVARLLRGFELKSIFAALLAAVILGLIHALMAPLAERIGGAVGKMLAQWDLSQPIELAVLFVTMLAINAVALKLAAWAGPGFRISDFRTALLAALILVIFNAVVGEAFGFVKSYFSNPNTDLAFNSQVIIPWRM